MDAIREVDVGKDGILIAMHGGVGQFAGTYALEPNASGHFKQTQASDAEARRPRDRWLWAMLAVTLVLNLLDAVFTLFAVRAGYAVEANPLMNELLSRGALSFMVGKVGMVSLGISLLWRFRCQAMAIVGGFAAFLTYAAIVAWHIQGVVGLVRPLSATGLG